ncbi:hypothetical protein [Methyloceanibacter stevinii]|uniref:hypothetical protein n=1 Tax=Methyloceanibacter stevinii TaxID=1774970 RepID=UPI001FCD93B0|nr:hypothetical protein [Methyloceanibacter stevinii]
MKFALTHQGPDSTSGKAGMPAFMTAPGRMRTSETQPSPGESTWVFTRSSVALSSCAAAPRSFAVGTVTTMLMS